MRRVWEKRRIVATLGLVLLAAAICYFFQAASPPDPSPASLPKKAVKGSRNSRVKEAKPIGEAAEAEQGGETSEEPIYERTSHLTGPPPALQLFANGGRVPTGAAEAAGLTEAERDEIERATSTMWKQFASLFSHALSVDKESSSPDLVTLKANSFPDAARAVISELEHQIEMATAPEKAEILKSIAYPPSSFGHSGRNNVLIEYSPAKKSYYYEYREPGTGRVIVSGTSSIDNFSSQFGNQIDLDEMVDSLNHH